MYIQQLTPLTNSSPRVKYPTPVLGGYQLLDITSWLLARIRSFENLIIPVLVVPTGIESFPSRIFIPVDTTGRLQGNVFFFNKKLSYQHGSGIYH